MGKGFFSPVELAQYDQKVDRTPKCGACGMYKTCESPKMKVAGKGDLGIMIIGEAPGAEEDEQGRPFVGKTGRRLQKTLASLGIDMFQDCWVTNALICRPPDNIIPNLKPVDYCRPNVVNAVEKYRPKIIIPLGRIAVLSLMTWLWKKDPGSITRWAGFRVPCREIGAYVCPTYHPSYIERADSEVLDLIWKEHLRGAIKLWKSPRPKKLDPTESVRVYLDSCDAAKALAQFALNCASRSGAFAFDYETNMLKPDVSRAMIRCCAVSDGTETIAFPWRGKPVQIMRKLLASKRYLKIAANIQFEWRWTRKMLDLDIVNWKEIAGDVVLGAHVLDNRKYIAGVKFQAFARLGYKSYDDHVTPYLKAKIHAGYAENRVRSCEFKDLLLYNGMDALCEYELSQLQEKELRNDE